MHLNLKIILPTLAIKKRMWFVIHEALSFSLSPMQDDKLCGSAAGT